MIARYRKFAVAAVGAIGAIAGLNLVDGTAQKWLLAVLAVASAAGVYVVPNQSKPV
jgi:uncharacterized membrane protein